MWDSRYRVVATAPDGRFTIVLGELEYDDPFSVIISYDPRLSQPWSRVDVRREINGLTYVAYGQGELVPVALSNEGDVYMLFENVQRSKIAGVGIGSEDADGRGEVWDIHAVGETLYVAGSNGQFYRSIQDGWEQISLPSPFSSISAMRPIGETGLLLVCEILREIDPAELPPWDKTNDETFLVSMNARLEAQRLFREQNPPQSVFYVYDDGEFVEVPAPLTRYARSAAVGVDGSILVVGLFGLVLLGDATGLAHRKIPVSDLGFLSGALFGDSVWLGTDYAIYRMQGGNFSEVSQELGAVTKNGLLTPSRFVTQNEKLYYVDGKSGISVFDGKIWENITVPKSLQDREFDPAAPL